MSQRAPHQPPGVRDFGPAIMCRRNYILDTIKAVYQRYGFMPLETPALETLATLTDKYGEEGDQLIFKVLKSGDFLAKTSPDDFTQGSKTLLPKIADKGLRYDLTVPLARYIVMHQQEVQVPFRRYQIQPVWRADRPQRGRFREFYQCDADVVGSYSLLCEAELLVMMHETLRGLGIKNFSIHLNHRQLLKGVAEAMGVPHQEQALCMALDKLDKIGWEKVVQSLEQHQFTAEACQELQALCSIKGGTEDKLVQLKEALKDSASGVAGVEAIQQILQYVSLLGIEDPRINVNPTLARGLAYYTGAVFEVTVQDVAIGSVGGGGRYDNLTGIFGLDDMPGVGFSFGLDRLYEVLDALALWPPTQMGGARVMVACFDPSSISYCMRTAASLRQQGIPTILYPDPGPLKKQLRYASKIEVPYVLIIGQQEQEKGIWELKNMNTGEQLQFAAWPELVQALNKGN